MTRRHMTGLAIVLALLLATAALAQQQTFRDENGREVGRSTTDSRGGTTFYDCDGPHHRAVCHQRRHHHGL